MSYLAPTFDPDVFVSYSGGNPSGGPALLRDWTRALIGRLRDQIHSLETDFKSLNIWMDSEIDPTANLTEELRKAVGSSGILMIVMSKSYLESSWCLDEREWFRKQIEGRPGESGRVFILRAQATDTSRWPDFLRDERGHAIPGLSFYDPQTGVPWGYPDLRDPNPEFAKELLRMQIWLIKRLRDLRERQANYRLVAPPISPVDGAPGFSPNNAAGPGDPHILGTNADEVQRQNAEAERLRENPEVLHGHNTAASVTSEVAAPAYDSRSATTPSPASDEAELIDSATQFIPDNPELDRDELSRGVLAIVLSRRLHRIWCKLNGAMPRVLTTLEPSESSNKSTNPMHSGENSLNGENDERTGFVVQLDAPWGGGKTTFANFVARVLNPYGYGMSTASFLHRRYPDSNLATIFLEDPPGGSTVKGSKYIWPEDARRPWIIVPFNAWQMEHCAPPWWIFYQTIRKSCLSAVLREGIESVDLSATKPSEKPRLRKRFCTWIWLLLCEYAWRLANPKVITLLSTTLISLSVMALMYWSRIIQLSGKPEQQPTFAVGNLIGLMFAGITAISAIWGFGALITESIVPGTNTLAERLSLGSGDPFERFRRHFHNTMLRIRRPVMVIIDDLDRCNEAFVVDLVRGIQTVLRSPRVIFLILGDRDWIEQAFAAHYSSVAEVSAGSEHTLGARFVEKIIQMCFILPDMRRDRQIGYVRWLLSDKQTSEKPESIDALELETARELRSAIRESTEDGKASLVHTAEIREAVSSVFQSLSAATTTSEKETTSAQIEQFVNDELAIRAATEIGVEKEISHLLMPVAPCLPSNPRQIKRIINAVTLYHAVALHQEGLDAADPRWVQLLLWVILMTEWPSTWRFIASFPLVVDALSADDPEAEIKKITPTKLPGSVEETLKEIQHIKANKALASLFIEDPDYPAHPVLSRTVVESFLPLTPLYGRKIRPKAENHGK